MALNRHLISSASRTALALTLGLGAISVHAQDTAPPPPASDPAQVAAAAEEGDAIVVTGIRASLANALNAKREAPQVLDAISAEDIGKFPDKNIGEALQRVTGVQLTRGGGEGQNISVRGTAPELTRVEINGETALSTQVGSGRQVDFRELPAEFVQRLEVVKSATPDMTEGGLGGTVRIITRRPFDSKEGYLAGSAQAVYSEIGKTWDPKFALIGSKLLANDTIGILASGTWERRSLWYDQARTTGWRRIDNDHAAGVQPLDLNADGEGDFYPDIPRFIINREKTERYALNGIIEFRPTDGFRGWIDATYTRGVQTLDSQFLQLTTALPGPGANNAGVSGSGVEIATAEIGPDDTTSFVRFNNRTAGDNGAAIAIPSQLAVALRNILGEIDRKTFNSQVGFNWDVGRLQISGRGSYSRARAYNNEINATGDYLGVSSLTIDYDNPQHAPDIILPFDPADAAGLRRLTVLRAPRYNHQTEYGAKLDVDYRPDGGFLTSIKAGVEKRDLSSDSKLFSVTRVLNGFNGTTTVSDTAILTGRRDVVQSTTTPAILTQQLQDIVRQNATLGDHDFFRTGTLGFAGIQRWLNLGMDVANAVGIPDPFDSPLPLDSWKVTDKNLAGYLQATFAFDLGFELSGVIGARVVNTKTVSAGNRVDVNPANTLLNVLVPVRFTGEYTEFLPSLNLRAEFIPNKLIGRATATEVLARPQQGQLAPSFRTDIVGRTGSRGNPGLQPFRARQYDLGLEYYVNRTSFVSVTGFRKRIGSFIFNTTQPETIDGIVYTITIPVNGTQVVTITGVEAGAQMSFDFLPAPFDGLGALANVTIQKDKGFESRDLITGGPLPFPGLSRTAYNLSLFYEKGPVSIRGSYNWRDKYLITPVGRGNNPEFGEAYGQVDISSSVTLNRNFSIFLDIVNLTDATRKENANSVYRRTLIETFGRRFYMGVRARF